MQFPVKSRCAILLLLLLGACANQPTAPEQYSLGPGGSVSPFSQGLLGDQLPTGWQPWIISRFNRNTSYRIVEDGGSRVLEADADSSASGVLQELAVKTAQYPTLSWRWRVSQLAPGADLTQRGSDDSPARVIVSFDGDRKKLDFEDRAMADLVKLFSGREMPYATLMYVWDSKLPVGTVLENAHSRRAMMIVVESGEQRVGQWLSFSRNIVEDYRRAYGESPGPIISVGVMTDSNTTHSKVTAYYGDIVLSVPVSDAHALLAPGSTASSDW